MNKSCKLFRNILGITMLVLLSNCSGKTKSESVNILKNGAIEINVFKAIEDARDFPLSKIIDDVEFVQLESTIDSYFSMYSSLNVTDQYILITSEFERRVLLFNRSGKFIRQIGSQGKGPGEYIYPHFATIDPQERFIIIKDAQGGNLFKYDLNGSILKQVDISDLCPNRPSWKPVFLDNNHFALSFNRPLISKNDHFNIAVFDLELNLVDRMIHIPNNDSLCLTNLSSQKLLEGKDNLISWESFVDTVYSVDLGEKPKPKYYINMDGNGHSIDFLTGRDMTTPNSGFYSAGVFADLPDFLVFLLYNNDNLNQIIFNKKKKIAFTLNDQKNCNSTRINNYDPPIWNNDLFGFPKVLIQSYFPKQNLVAFPIYIEEVSPADLECMQKVNVLLPEKRDQLTEMIKSYTGEELPLLTLMHVK